MEQFDRLRGFWPNLVFNGECTEHSVIDHYVENGTTISAQARVALSISGGT